MDDALDCSFRPQYRNMSVCVCSSGQIAFSRRAEKNELKQKRRRGNSNVGNNAVAAALYRGESLQRPTWSCRSREKKQTSTKAELAKTQRHLQDRSQEATSAKAKLTETERHLQERSQEARWAICMGNYYRSVLEEKKQDTLTSEKHMRDLVHVLFQACAETTHASIDS